MRVLMVTPRAPAQDGLRFYSEQLINALARVADRIEIRIYAWNPPSKGARFFYLLKTVPEYLRKLRTSDVVHVQDVAVLYVWNLPLMLLLARLMRVPAVITVHETNENARMGKVLNAIDWLSMRLANAVIVHSNTHRNTLPAAIRKKAHVIPHGVARTSSDGTQRMPREILLAGFINRWKGHDCVIRAARLLVATFPDVHVMIVGKPHDRKYTRELKRLIRDTNMTNHMTMHDRFVERDVFESHFHRASVVVLPYHRATMSGIFAQAIGAETPVVMSSLPVFREVTNNTLLYVPVDDERALARQIARLFTDADLRTAQQTHVRELAATYAWPNVAQRTFRVYRSVTI